MRCAPLFSLVALTLVVLSDAEPLLSPYRVHEKRTHIPSGWHLTKRHDTTSVITLRFALKQSNIQDIESYLLDVSHPESPNYGRHWSAGDIARTFAPSDGTIDIVRGWLVESGINAERIVLTRTKGWIEVNANVEEAERLMNAEYNVYTHTSGKEHVACEVYHLPEHVQPHVDFVTPSVHFDAKLTRRSDGNILSPVHNIGQPGVGITPKTTGTVAEVLGELDECDKYITPICLRTLYGLFYEPIATEKNSYGIVEYSPQTYLKSDLQLFAKHFAAGLYGKEPNLVSIDGGFIQTTNTSFEYVAEPSLDLEYGMALVTEKQNVTLYQTGDLVEGGSFNNFLDAVDGSYCTFEGGDDPNYDGIYPDTQGPGYEGPESCGITRPAYVISTSYGMNEADTTPFYIERQCAEYAKLGLMGVTVLYSSGDYGVAGTDGKCLNSTGIPSLNGNAFAPIFPGTCPYVTSIGATMIKANGSVLDPEVACMRVIYSGGGFSNVFAVPEYQKDAVHSYLTNHRPTYSSTIWNATGMSRAYPDISANGANYVMAGDGRFRVVYGTSASAPVVGAILTMINDARLAVGKGPIGFINPTIYTAGFADAFNDITEGNNPGCNTDGFSAACGWDPVTGLGTPNFSELLSRWLSLP